MSKKIWVDKNGRSFGPYSEEEVLQYLRAGQLHPADAAAWEGDTKWTELSKLVSFTPPSADPSPPPEVKTQKFADTPVVVKSSQPRRTRIQPRRTRIQPRQPYVQPQQPHITVQVQQPYVQPQQPYAHPYAVPPKSKIVAFLLCFFLGVFRYTSVLHGKYRYRHHTAPHWGGLPYLGVYRSLHHLMWRLHGRPKKTSSITWCRIPEHLKWLVQPLHGGGAVGVL